MGKYSGSLHDRAYPWMKQDAQRADLVLVLGTSLGGLNADQVATKTAFRSTLPPPPAGRNLAPGSWVSIKPPTSSSRHMVKVSKCKALVTDINVNTITVRCASLDEDDSESEEEDVELSDPITVPADHPMQVIDSNGGGLGTVCMNLQQTVQDGKMTLRLFGKSDDLLRLLILELGYSLSIVQPPQWPKVSRALVPYGRDGKRLPDPVAKRMWLDLRVGQGVRITDGHNIQGAKQPQYMHIGAKKPVTVKGQTRQPAAGNGTVKRRCEETCSFMLDIEGVQMRLGIWWLDSAMRGGVEQLPIVNNKPEFE